MKYLLDTNVCVGFLNQRKPLLTQRFLSVPTSDKVICSIVRAELIYGAHKSQRRVSSLQVIENFVANNLTLVTHNTAEFSRVPHLPLDDWES